MSGSSREGGEPVYRGTGKVLTVDLGAERHAVSDQKLGEDYIGGAGYCARLLFDSTSAHIDPLSPDNVLVMAPGYFTGLFVPTASKTVFAAKGPLTGFFCESVMGGPIGTELKHSGYDALVVKGKARRPSAIIIRDRDVSIVDAGKLWRRSTRECASLLKKEFEVVAATIGIAGENLVRFASIDCEERQAGRGGLGAVMGSKNLKAIGVRGTSDINVKDADKLVKLTKMWHKEMVNSATYREDVLYGTGEFLEWINKERGVFPTKNWQKSFFEDRKQLDPYYWSPKYAKKNKACNSCVKPCGRVFSIEEGKYAGTRLDGVEYETLYSLGGDVELKDIEAVAKANELCDLYGMDTISAGGVAAFAMELWEKGILTVGDVEGLALRFGDADALHELIDMMANRKGIGNVLAEGVKAASSKIGRGSEDFAIHVKGMEPPAYDVRGIKGMGLGFMTSPRGACHLRSCAYSLELTGKFWKFENVDRFSSAGKGFEVKELEDLMTIYDCLGVCKFSRVYFLASGFEDYFDAIDGRKLTENDLMRTGERINNLKHLFNLREGFTRKDCALPKRVTSEPIKGGAANGHLISEQEMDSMLSEYFNARGWDIGGNIPLEKLKELGLN